MIKLKNILAENILRFGTKNLSESEKQRITEIFGEYEQFKIFLNALDFKIIPAGLPLPNDLQSTTKTKQDTAADRQSLNDFYKKSNPTAPAEPVYTIYIVLRGPLRKLPAGANVSAARWRSIVRLYKNNQFIAGDDKIVPFTKDNGQTWYPDYNAIQNVLKNLLKKYPDAAKALNIKP